MAENLKNLITDYVNELNDSVLELSPIVDTQIVATARGVWLDFLADLVGCKPRTKGLDNSYTMNDVAYRTLINARIDMNKGGATLENMANVIRYTIYLTDDNDWDSVKDIVDFEMKSEDANLFVDLNNIVLTSSEGSARLSAVLDMMPAGVGLWMLSVPSNPFIVSDQDNLPPLPYGGGCSSVYDSNAGGELAFFIT